MKFKPYKMSSLNESVRKSVGMNDSGKLDVVGTVEPSFTTAIKEEEARVERDKDTFKDFHKNAEDFIKVNHDRNVKLEKNKDLKRMKLSESIFDNYETVKLHKDDEEIVNSPAEGKSVSPTINEALEFGDPLHFERGATVPLVYDSTSDITQLVKMLGEGEDYKEFAMSSLKRLVPKIMDNKQSVENFNAYWTERYPAAIDYIDKQIALIPEDVLNSILGVSEGLLDVNVPMTANVKADGNSVSVLSGGGSGNINKEDLDEATAVMEPPTKKRARASNEKKHQGDYSSEDLWLAVYDELSSDLDNEGSGQQVDKQIKAKKGERYEHVYPVEGSTDIVVYGTDPSKFDFAKKVADYYGVTYDEPKEDRNRMTNDYYKYSMRIHIPEDEMYEW